MGAAGRDASTKPAAESGPTWSTWREALRVVAYRPHLRKTIGIALLVGTILFCINQLNVVLEHEADAFVWFKVGLTYLVPFCVSNAGILLATRRISDERGDGASASG